MVRIEDLCEESPNVLVILSIDFFGLAFFVDIAGIFSYSKLPKQLSGSSDIEFNIDLFFVSGV